MIYGSSGDMATQIASLKSTTAATPLTAASLRAKTYNKTTDQSIVVRLGGLDWIVTYVSTDISGNLVATLWLSNNHQDAWSGKNQSLGDHYGFANGGLYSDWSDDYESKTVDAYPSNMYGTSYIRVETLNNPSKRQYTTTGGNALVDGTTQSLTHPFALFTAKSLGLTNFMTTPDQIKWMINRQNPAAWGNNYWNSNNALTSQNAYNYTGAWYDEDYVYENITGYDYWGEDYLWLPSIVEVGYTGESHGLWQTSTAERTTYDGSTTEFNASTIGEKQSLNAGKAYVYSWLRTARANYAYHSCGLSSAGTTNFYYDTVSRSRAVRPAFFLKLDAASVASQSSPQFNITITNTNDSNNEYLDKNGDSYGSAYEADKCKLTVQFYTTRGTLVASQTFSTLTDTTINIGTNLTFGTTYRVRIIAPTYMRYTTKHFVDVENDMYNGFSTSTFMVYYDGRQGVEVEVIGLQDDSWLTFYK